MVTTAPSKDPAEEEQNPILAEIAKMDSEGDDADIVREIADLNARETQEETPPEAQPAPAAEQPAPEAQPAPTAPSVPPATPAPSAVDPQVQQYIAQLEMAQAKAQEERDLRILQEQTLAAQQRFVAQGVPEEAAAQIAQEYLRPAWLAYQQARAHQVELTAERLHVREAAQLAQEHGLPVDTLLALPREGMRQMAATLSQGKKHEAEMKALKEEMDRLKKAAVPPQQFDSNRAAPIAPSDERSLLDQYNRGVRTPQTQAAAKRAAGL